jgi:dCTP deaminase
MATASRSGEARCGLILNVTPLEPEWEGGQAVPEVGFAGRTGKYMGQRGVALPKL